MTETGQTFSGFTSGVGAGPVAKIETVISADAQSTAAGERGASRPLTARQVFAEVVLSREIETGSVIMVRLASGQAMGEYGFDRDVRSGGERFEQQNQRRNHQQNQ